MADPATPSSTVDVTILRQRFAELRRRQSVGRVPLIVLTIVIVVFFALFTFLTVDRVKENFNQPAVQKAVSDRLPEVIPLAGNTLQKAAVNALPVYRQLAVERYEKIRPELGAKAMARLDKIPAQTGEMMGVRLNASFDKVLKRIEPELKKAFPGLTDAQKQDLIAGYFHDAINARNQAVAAHIDTMYTNELSAVHGALDKFELPASDEAAPSSEQMQREFMHSLLVLADYEVMNGDLAPAGTTAKAVATTQPVAK